MKSAPALTPKEEEDAQYQFTAECERELIVRGLKNDAAILRLIAIRPTLRVTPRLSGDHEVVYSGKDGRPYRLPEAARVIADEIRDEARSAAFGPNPVGLLVDRLVALSIPRDEAEDLARYRIERLEDGRVAAITENRERLFFAKDSDPTDAVSAAVRIILAERARRSRRQELRETVSGSADAPQAANVPAADRHRHFVAGAL